MAVIFGEFFFWSPFPGKQGTKILKKLVENSEENSGETPRQEFEKFGELLFCNCSDLRKSSWRDFSEVRGRSGANFQKGA